MVDNRYATALVIGSVLSLLACVYLSVAMGTPYWYQYHSQPASNDFNNGSDLQRAVQDFDAEDVDEYNYSLALFKLNGTLGLWWRCIVMPDSTMATICQAFTLAQQWETRFSSPGNVNSEEDLLRTYLWKCQFLLPLISVGLVFLAALIGVFACLCRSITPTLFVGLLHLLAGLCSLATVCCFLAGVHLLHKESDLPEGMVSSPGWSLFLALVSSPLQIMAAALFIWAARSHRKNYTRMIAYRVA
ncbi:claudin domain-containing protein 1b [Misgurnus anguillicaudatus]|uniref:claudin domain-containing protein 1b n=1 Tax=Misgurnus anguillicaudatus TaxID=75329 RepID=UPI003CCF015B